MQSKIILVDLDGPLADFEGEFLKRWRKKFPDEFFIPFEERKTFFISNDYPENLRDKIIEIPLISGFFSNLPPVAESLKSVKEIAALGHKVFICTSDIYGSRTSLAEKRTWIQEYLGHDFAKTMIFTRDKTLIRGDYLIDDKPAITGLLEPDWKHIVFDQPFNRDVTDKARIKSDWSNWKEIIPSSDA